MLKNEEQPNNEAKLAKEVRQEMLSATVHVASLKTNLEKLLSKVKTLTTLEPSDQEALMRQAIYVYDQCIQIGPQVARLATELGKHQEH